MPREPQTPEKAHAALTEHPERDRFWAGCVRDALKHTPIPLEDLRCYCGTPLTEYCMIGCPSNGLRTLLAQAGGYEIPGLWMHHFRRAARNR